MIFVILIQDLIRDIHWSLYRFRHYIISRIVALMLIGVAGTYLLNNILFTHQHILENGTVVIHAHPYDKSDSKPDKSHHHDKAELFILHTLKILFFTPALIFVLIMIRRSEKLCFVSLSLTSQHYNIFRIIRAPPDF